mgnify:CR=1 FL=1
MSTYAKSLALVTASAAAGSALYLFYNKPKIRKEKKELKENKISFDNFYNFDNFGKFVNPGLLFGTLLGCYFSYKGRPNIVSLLK